MANAKSTAHRRKARDLSLERVIDEVIADVIERKATWETLLKGDARLAQIKKAAEDDVTWLTQLREADTGPEPARQAQEAIAALSLDEPATHTLVSDLLTARRILRDHRHEIDRARFLMVHLAKAQASLDKALRYIAKSGFVTVSGENPLLEARRIITGEISGLGWFGELQSGRLSRRGDTMAARSRAIAWIKISVQRLSKKPHFSHVIILCDFALGGTASLDAVKRAHEENLSLTARAE
jgi:hypothetical protein